MSRAARLTGWTRMPRCWDSEAAWHDWWAVHTDACSPCADCTPAYREAMRAQGRCERPEVIFVRGGGELSGVSADDPRFARLLLGLAGPGEIVGPMIEHTEAWTWLLARIRARARPEVRHAIDLWMREARSAA